MRKYVAGLYFPPPPINLLFSFSPATTPLLIQIGLCMCPLKLSVLRSLQAVVEVS